MVKLKRKLNHLYENKNIRCQKYFILQAKEKKIVHIETRKGESGKFQLYLEIESKSTDDWNNIKSLVETLNGIDIKPREDINIPNQILEEETDGR